MEKKEKIILIASVSTGISTAWTFYVLCQTIYLSVRRKIIDIKIKTEIRRTSVYQITFDEAKEAEKRTRIFRIG